MSRGLVLLFIFLVSCSRLELMTHDCSLPILVGKSDIEKHTSFSFEKKVYTPFAPLVSEDVELKELLEEQGLKCSDIVQIDLKIENKSSDALWGLIPFLSRKTLVLSGEKKN